MVESAAGSVNFGDTRVDRHDSRSKQAVGKIFGRQDVTPWAVLWLAVAWAAAELVPGLSLLKSALGTPQSDGNAIVGGFLTASIFAVGALWIWYAIVGSVSIARRWQILTSCCLVLIGSRYFLAPPLQTLVAVFAWAMMGTMATALGVRYLLGFILTTQETAEDAHLIEDQTQRRNELSIWMLLRYTLAAAVLAWFTRSVGELEDGVLSSLEIVCLGIPLGLLNGGLSFLMIWMLSRKYWWIYVGLFIGLALPISGGASYYASIQFVTNEMLVFSIFASVVSLLGHFVLFGLPLVAQGFYFGVHPAEQPSRAGGLFARNS